MKEKMEPKDCITLSVVFEGTIFSIEEPHTLLHQMFHKDIEGVRITSNKELHEHPKATHFKMGFNGCGYQFGTKGLLFGSGLDTQYNEVFEVVSELIRSGKRVKLNAIGLSRGGIAAMMLVKKLAHIDTFHLQTDLLLLDPVPGNLLITAKLDYFNWTLTNQSLDLSQSRNLVHADAVYPYLEVGDEGDSRLDKILANFHVPIRPSYPRHRKVKVREDIILGAHLNAFQLSSPDEQERLMQGVNVLPIIRQLSKEFTYNFLKNAGGLSQNIALQDREPVIAPRFALEQNKWVDWLSRLILNIVSKKRPIHSQDNSEIVASNKGTYLNRIHRELNGIFLEATDDLSIKIIPDRSSLTIEEAPLTNTILKKLVKTIEDGMTPLSKGSKKGGLIQTISSKLDETTDLSQEQLSFVLRDIIAIALQRNRFSYSFFSTTTSGTVLVNVINTPEFRAVRQCVKDNGEPVVYSDLASYVLGRNDLRHFNNEYKTQNLEQIEQTPLGGDLFPRVF